MSMSRRTKLTYTAILFALSSILFTNPSIASMNSLGVVAGLKEAVIYPLVDVASFRSVPVTSSALATAVDDQHLRAWIVQKNGVVAVYDKDGTGIGSFEIGSNNASKATISSAEIMIDKRDGSAWIAADTVLYHFSATGVQFSSFTLKHNATSMALDIKVGTVWVSDGKNVYSLDSNGKQVLSLDLPASFIAENLAFDLRLGYLLVGSKKEILLYNRQGKKEGGFTVSGIKHLAADGAGNIWGASNTSVYRYAVDGTLQLEIPVENTGAASIEAIASDVNDGSLWVLSQQMLIRISAGGNLITKSAPLRQMSVLALNGDINPPTLSLNNFSNGDLVTPSQELGFSASDIGVGIDIDSMSMTLNDQTADLECRQKDEQTLTCTPRIPFSAEVLNLKFTIQDNALNLSQPVTINLKLDTDGDGVADEVDTYPNDPARWRLAEVTGVALTLNHTDVHIKWNGHEDPTNTSGYNIYRKEAGQESETKLNSAPVTVTELIDSNVHNGSGYQYRVAAVDARNNEGVPGDYHSFFVAYNTSTVSNLAAQRVVGDGNISWDTVEGLRYQLYRAQGDGEMVSLQQLDSTSYIDNDAHWSMSYRYQVATIADFVNVFTQEQVSISGPRSAEVVLAPLPPLTIDINDATSVANNSMQITTNASPATVTGSYSGAAGPLFVTAVSDGTAVNGTADGGQIQLSLPTVGIRQWEITLSEQQLSDRKTSTILLLLLDSDSDGVTEELDQCPDTPIEEKADEEGCSDSQKDADGDGVTGTADICPNTPAGEEVDASGCADSERDSDKDGTVDLFDTYPNDPTRTRLAKVSGVTATLVKTSVVIRWAPHEDQEKTTGYDVYRKKVGEEDEIKLNLEPLTTTELTDSNVSNGKGYQYRVVALDAQGNVGESHEYHNFFVAYNSYTVSNVVAVWENGIAKISWDAVPVPGFSYQIYRTDGMLPTVELAQVYTNSYLDATASSYGSYRYQVSTIATFTNVFTQQQVSVVGPPSNEVALTTPLVLIFRDSKTLPDGSLQVPVSARFGSANLTGRWSGTTGDVRVFAVSGEERRDASIWTFLNMFFIALPETNGAKWDITLQEINSPSREVTTTVTLFLDNDGDGVTNEQDACPGTRLGQTVDSNGCSAVQTDADGDGVLAPTDLCPNTPPGAVVDSDGCADSERDNDNDGVPDIQDLCADTPPGESVDSSGCAASQKDSDGDGVNDSQDSCPSTPIGGVVGDDGCTDSERDSDKDGVPDIQDQCPATPAGEQADSSGCSASQRDSDADGYKDNVDLCPETRTGEVVDGNGCAAYQRDTDNDSVTDDLDQCSATPAGEIADSNGCSASQRDTDGDGYKDNVDLCPTTPAGEAVDNEGCADSERDTDRDGTVDINDAFPEDPNEWLDTDSDGIGDNSDPDRDNDGVLNDEDAFPLDSTETADLDNDGIGDNSDPDRDGDGYANVDDYFPDDPNAWSVPSVTITSPASLTTFGASPIEISGTIDDPLASLTINGIEVPHSGGAYQASVAIEEGHNAIVVRAVDLKGHEGTATVSVSLDKTPPYITLESPQDGDVVRSPTITVTGLVNDIVRGTVAEDQAVVLVNGMQAVVSNRSYMVEGVPLIEGDNLITINASDAVGNSATKSITVTYKPVTGAQIVLESGQGQGAQILSTLAEPLAVKLVDEQGNPVANKNVIFRVLRGDGVLAPGTEDEAQGVLAVTDSQGIAATTFQLGSRAGEGVHRVRAKAVGFDGEVLFHASADPNPGDKVSVIAGNNQRGIVRQPLPQPFVVAVTDNGANLILNAEVEFTVKKGGGHFLSNDQQTLRVMTDTDGRASVQYVLGADEGLDVQYVEANLVGTGAKAGFTVSGFMPGPAGDTKISGVVLDNQDKPIPGVTLRIDGTNRQAVTDDDGQFTITEAPVGPVHLMADGSTASVEGEWPTLSYNIVTVSGVDNPLAAPIYLVKLDTEHGVWVGEKDIIYTLPDLPGFKLKVERGSVTFPDGSKSGQLSVTAVNANKVPMPPPNGMQPQLIVTIQPHGAKFDPPAELTLPNVDGHKPGAEVEMYAYDHDLEEFVTIGLGTVSRDGSVITSNHGVGVIKAGWTCSSQPGGSACCEGSDGCSHCYDKKGECPNATCELVKGRSKQEQSPYDCRINLCEEGKYIINDKEMPEDELGDCLLFYCSNGNKAEKYDEWDIPEKQHDCKDWFCNAETSEPDWNPNDDDKPIVDSHINNCHKSSCLNGRIEEYDERDPYDHAEDPVAEDCKDFSCVIGQADGIEGEVYSPKYDDIGTDRPETECKFCESGDPVNVPDAQEKQCKNNVCKVCRGGDCVERVNPKTLAVTNVSIDLGIEETYDLWWFETPAAHLKADYHVLAEEKCCKFTNEMTCEVNASGKMDVGINNAGVKPGIPADKLCKIANKWFGGKKGGALTCSASVDISIEEYGIDVDVTGKKKTCGSDGLSRWTGYAMKPMIISAEPKLAFGFKIPDSVMSDPILKKYIHPEFLVWAKVIVRGGAYKAVTVDNNIATYKNGTYPLTAQFDAGVPFVEICTYMNTCVLYPVYIPDQWKAELEALGYTVDRYEYKPDPVVLIDATDFSIASFQIPDRILDGYCN